MNRRSVLKLLGLAPLAPGLFREAVAYKPQRYFLFNGAFLKGGTHIAGGWHVKWSEVGDPASWYDKDLDGDK